MPQASAIALGALLGLRHAADADHLAAIGALVEGKDGVRGAVRTAALWGLGHSVSFLGFGLLIVAAGVRIPAALERAADWAVALTLALLGAWGLLALLWPSLASRRSAGVRPLLIGGVHGLAGSAGVALVALSAVPTRLGAFGYLLCFCAGVVLGMVAITALLSLPLAWTARRSQLVRAVASLVSLLAGLALVGELVVGLFETVLQLQRRLFTRKGQGERLDGDRRKDPGDGADGVFGLGQDDAAEPDPDRAARAAHRGHRERVWRDRHRSGAGDQRGRGDLRDEQRVHLLHRAGRSDPYPEQPEEAARAL